MTEREETVERSAGEKPADEAARGTAGGFDSVAEGFLEPGADPAGEPSLLERAAGKLSR